MKKNWIRPDSMVRCKACKSTAKKKRRQFAKKCPNGHGIYCHKHCSKVNGFLACPVCKDPMIKIGERR